MQLACLNVAILYNPNVFHMNPVLFSSLASATDFVVGDKTYPFSELFAKGGFFMWPILFLSVVAVVVLVMCFFSTRSKSILPADAVSAAESCIRKKDYVGLADLCEATDSCYTRVMLAVANFMQRNPDARFEEVSEIAVAEGGRQAGYISRQISWLSDIGALAPMLGLLGTVVGMMKTFFEMSNSDASGTEQRIGMANGVAEALITTAGGLLLAIPVLFAYAYFRSRVHKCVGDLESAVTHSISIVATQLQKPDTDNTFGSHFRAETLPKVGIDPTSLRDVRGM